MPAIIVDTVKIMRVSAASSWSLLYHSLSSAADAVVVKIYSIPDGGRLADKLRPSA